MRTLWKMCAALPFVVAACAPKAETSVADSAATAATPTVDAAAVRATIEQNNVKLADAFGKSDSATIASMYADDAMTLMAGQPAWYGKTEIMKNGSEMMKAVQFSDVKFTTTSLDVAGDFLIETGNYQMTLTPKGGKPEPDKGKYVTVWKKQADGSYKIYRDVPNTDNPPPKG